MASMLKLPRMLSGEKSAVALAAGGPLTDEGTPTTQVRMGHEYDPVEHVSMMDQVLAAGEAARAPAALPVIGHLPTAKQVQILLTLMFVFFALAGLMLWLDARNSAQHGRGWRHGHRDADALAAPCARFGPGLPRPGGGIPGSEGQP